jgi:hypothetical protein
LPGPPGITMAGLATREVFACSVAKDIEVVNKSVAVAIMEFANLLDICIPSRSV